MKDGDRVGVLMKKICTFLVADINKVLKEYDITKSQMDVLRYITRQEKEVSQRDIEEFFGITNPTVSGIVKRLEHKELIHRKNSPTDARIKYIYKTKKADELLETLKQIINEKEKQISRGLTGQEIEQLYDVLNRILKNINKP